jgi:hypothetical protein
MSIQVICAHEVEDIDTMTRTSMDGGLVDLLIGLDNTQWLSRHVEDAWEPDNNIWLMKFAF